jgi:ribulose-5-phosphate 4-epimerase/fuculose-1-phosphate aldolase
VDEGEVSARQDPYRNKPAWFARECRRAAAHGLVQCSSGNISWRAGGGRMLVKSSRAWLATLTARNVAVCRIEDGASLNGVKPTVEIGFHAGILRARPDVNVVAHVQSPFATLLACRGGRVPNFEVVPEIPFYIGPVAWVPCLLPGSPQLADAVVRAMRAHDLAMLRNHGQVVAAEDFDHAIQMAVFFELACRILVQGGRGVRPVAPRVCKALRAARSGRRAGAA